MSTCRCAAAEAHVWLAAVQLAGTVTASQPCWVAKAGDAVVGGCGGGLAGKSAAHTEAEIAGHRAVDKALKHVETAAGQGVPAASGKDGLLPHSLPSTMGEPLA